MHKKQLGIFGENQAAEFLQNKGFKIIERNWRHKQDEIDIIAMVDIWLVFVEVKTRSGTAFGKPYEAVDSRKEKALMRAAKAYIQEKNIDTNIRFDIVSILVSPHKDVLIEHLEFAITP